MRALDNEFSREGNENYENKMAIIKEKEFDKLDNTRHTLEVKLQEDLIKAKEIEKKEFEDGRNQVKALFLANAEYQKSLSEEADLRNTIENACIKLDVLQI